MIGLTNSTSIRAAMICSRDNPLKGVGVSTVIDCKSDEIAKFSIDISKRNSKRPFLTFLNELGPFSS